MKCNVFRVHPCVAPPFFSFFLVTAASYFNVQRYHSLFKHFLIRCVSLLFQALLQWVTLNTCHFLFVLVHMFHPFPELSFLEQVVNTIVILLHVATHSIALPPAMCELPTSTFLLSLPAEHIARLWMFANLVGLKKKASKSVWFSCAFLVDIDIHIYWQLLWFPCWKYIFLALSQWRLESISYITWFSASVWFSHLLHQTTETLEQQRILHTLYAYFLWRELLKKGSHLTLKEH